MEASIPSTGALLHGARGGACPIASDCLPHYMQVRCFMEPEAARATFTDTVATYRRKGCEAWLAVRGSFEYL